MTFNRYARLGIVGATDLPTMPRADRTVILREGTDFVVPDTMRFVLRGLGVSDSQGISGKLGVKILTVDQGSRRRTYTSASARSTASSRCSSTNLPSAGPTTPDGDPH